MKLWSCRDASECRFGSELSRQSPAIRCTPCIAPNVHVELGSSYISLSSLSYRAYYASLIYRLSFPLSYSPSSANTCLLFLATCPSFLNFLSSVVCSQPRPIPLAFNYLLSANARKLSLLLPLQKPRRAERNVVQGRRPDLAGKSRLQPAWYEP